MGGIGSRGKLKHMQRRFSTKSKAAEREVRRPTAHQNGVRQIDTHE